MRELEEQLVSIIKSIFTYLYCILVYFFLGVFFANADVISNGNKSVAISSYSIKYEDKKDLELEVIQNIIFNVDKKITYIKLKLPLIKHINSHLQNIRYTSMKVKLNGVLQDFTASFNDSYITLDVIKNNCLAEGQYKYTLQYKLIKSTFLDNSNYKFFKKDNIEVTLSSLDKRSIILNNKNDGIFLKNRKTNLEYEEYFNYREHKYINDKINPKNSKSIKYDVNTVKLSDVKIYSSKECSDKKHQNTYKRISMLDFVLYTIAISFLLALVVLLQIDLLNFKNIGNKE